MHIESNHGSFEWHMMRAGKATASCFSQIVTESKGDLSKSCAAYADRLVAEMLLGHHLDKFEQNYWMERGQELEAEACDSFEILTGLTLKPGGVFLDENGVIAASPDRRVYDGDILVGVAEIKCPAPWTHVGNVTSGDAANGYKQQVQGQMLLAGVGKNYFYSYHPQIPSSPVIIPIDRDYCAKMQRAFNGFSVIMADKITKLERLGAVFKIQDLSQKWKEYSDGVEKNA